MSSGASFCLVSVLSWPSRKPSLETRVFRGFKLCSHRSSSYLPASKAKVPLPLSRIGKSPNKRNEFLRFSLIGREVSTVLGRKVTVRRGNVGENEQCQQQNWHQ